MPRASQDREIPACSRAANSKKKRRVGGRRRKKKRTSYREYEEDA
jgi:hypothetical protein